EASPGDVQRLILAQKAGTVTAVLRGNTDTQPIVASTMDASQLFGVTAARAGPGHPGPAPLTTEIIIGGRGGGHAEDKLMQLMGMDRPFPVSSTPLSPPQASSNSDTLR